MKNKRDFSRDNAFFGDDGVEFETVKLPELSEVVANKKRGGGKTAPLILLLAATALICVMIFIFGADSKPPMEITIPTEDCEEWRGAFAERRIYEECLECSVSLKVGKGQNVKYWSGVILSSDGWIATDALMIGDAEDGRVCVTLSDGREYGADSIRRDKDSGAAVLKIAAEGLRAAELSDRELQGGERTVAVSEGRDIIICSVSSADKELRVNINGGSGSEGAPVFDNDGYLVGLCVGQTDSGNTCDAESLGALMEDVKK